MSLRWMVFGSVVAGLTLVAGCSMPWDSDCTVGECGPERNVAEELADDADVEIDGEEELGEVGDGESLVAVGEVTDEYAEVIFEPEVGEWYDISVYSRGLPTPSFVVKTGAFGYERWSPFHESGLGERPVVPVENREHTIRIYSEYFEEQSAGPPASPEDEFWEFVLEIEHRDAPEPTTIEDGEEVTVDPTELREHLYVIEEPDETSRFRVKQGISTNMNEARLQYGEGLEEGDDRQIDLAAGPDVDDAVFWADYVGAPSAASDFEVEVDSQSGLAPGQVEEQQRDLDEGEALVVENDSNFAQGLFDVEIERDGEVVAEGEILLRPMMSETPELRALYVAEEAGEVTVRIENKSNSAMSEASYDVVTTMPEDLGVLEAGADVEKTGGEVTEGSDYGLYEFELTEAVISEFRRDDDSDSLLYVFEHSMLDQERSQWGQKEPMEPGTYRVVVYEFGDSDSSENFEIDLTEPEEPVEVTYDISVDSSDLFQVRNPYWSDDGIAAAMSLDCPNEEPLELQDLGDESRQKFVFSGTGDCEAHFETSTWYEELEDEPEIEVIDGEDRGQLEVDGGAVESTVEDDDLHRYPFVFELDESAWVTWRLEEGEDYELGLDIDWAKVEGFEVLEPVERRRMVGQFEAGLHAVVVGMSDEEIAGETMLLEAEPTADVAETDAPDLEVPLEDEGPVVAEMEVDGCGSASRVAVDVDVGLSTHPEAHIELAGPSGETARLVDEDHLWPLNSEAPKTFPDGVDPEESMASLGEAGADGTWELELVEVGVVESGMSLEEWSVYLWCDG